MTFEIDSNNIQNEDVQLTTDANGDLIIEHIPTGATFVYDQANDNWKPSGGLDIGGNDITNAGAVNADSADITNNLLAGQVGTSSEPVDVAAATVSAESVDAGSVNTDGLVANQSVRLARSTETISSGVINYSAPSIEVLGEGGSSDDLDQITGGRGYGEIAILQSGTANITVRSNQSSSDGRILLDGGTNKTLNNPADRLTLHLDTSLSPDTWCQISYSNF